MIAAHLVHDGTRGRLARTPSKFASSMRDQSGDVWTPPAGKRFRLLKYSIEVTGDAYFGGGGTWTAQLFDGATNLGIQHRIVLPATAPTSPQPVAYSSGWIDLGAVGISSASSGQALRLVCSNVLQAGYAIVRVAGTEETPTDSAA